MKSRLNVLRASHKVRDIASRRRRGGAVLELAICGVLLAVIVFGAVEGGYYFYVKDIMTDAVREGCRNGVMGYSAGAAANGNPPEGSIASASQVVLDQLMQGGLLATGTTVSTSGSTSTIGNYTLTFYDCSALTGAPATITSIQTGMTVGDGLLLTLTANWSVVGANFRPMKLIGGTGSHTITESCMMRKEAL
ncbi:MAG: TadE family protein [Tepidisphaeraceae bacterium]|jgi:hypothetical protein